MMDISKLNLPAGLIPSISAFAIGITASVYFYEKVRLPGLEAQLALAVSEKNASDEDRSKVLASQGGCTPSMLASKSQEAQSLADRAVQLAKWNEEWRAANTEIVAQRDACLSRDSVTKRLRDLEDKRQDVSNAIVRLTSVRCDGKVDGCDLIPIAQRQLRAMEQERDQLQAQILDLQSKLAR
jgi:hypothetical protein